MNAALGPLAMRGTTLGSNNTAPGRLHSSRRRGGRNWQGIVGAIANGRKSAQSTTTGTGNPSVGATALRDNVAGEFNVAVGRASLVFQRCVGISDECAEFATGNDSTMLGYRASGALIAASSKR